ncbi:MAG: EF-P beta-lysylation protein EpmB [Firmicutes bacterium]|nr:EF-P beta-lysylation protein EpmB [Bacillota bacterium]
MSSAPNEAQVIHLSAPNDWQRQLANAYKDPLALGEALQLPSTWIATHAPARRLFPMLVPQHFAGLMRPGDINDPLLRQVWPLHDEFNAVDGYSTDPLGEDDATAQPGLLHKYSSRVLVILRGGCAVNCRYCFRRHFPYGEHKFGQAQLNELVRYIVAHPEVNEVILSGGDPLMAKDDKIATLLDALEPLAQITRVRIHSRLPVVIPDRLTQGLADRFYASRLQIILVIHANHAQEISPELRQGLAKWRQAGAHLLNQSVLLRGVNDDAVALAQLSEALFAVGVMPYYLHQLDKVAGAAHFAVSDTLATDLIQQLQASLPGFLVPKLVREIAGEASKTPLWPSES